MRVQVKNQEGFSAVESVLVLVIVAVIAGVGWYVYHIRQSSDKALNTAATTSNNAGPRFTKSTKTAAAVAPGTDNSSLQSGLNDVTSTSNSANQDMNAANTSLSDQSTLTTVPQ